MNKEQAITLSRGDLVGIAICPKCNIINKFRSDEDFRDNMGKCHSCGTEVAIQKRMGK